MGSGTKSEETESPTTTMPTFDGDLGAKYKAGGAGTYTRDVNGKVWTKVGGAAVCPTCGQPLPAGFKL